LFDEDNFMHNKGGAGTIWKRKDQNGLNRSCIIGTGGYVFNTEAHPVDIAALSCRQVKDEVDEELRALEDGIDLVNNILPLNKMANCDLDQLMNEPLYNEETDNLNESSAEPTQSSISMSSPDSETTNRAISEEEISSTDSRGDISQAPNESGPVQSKHSQSSNEMLTGSDDSFLPNSPVVENAASVDAEFELPVAAPTFPNSAFDLTQYYEELKLMAHELEHGKEGIEIGTQVGANEESSYELLFCPSQPFLARLSLRGQMFDS